MNLFRSSQFRVLVGLIVAYALAAVGFLYTPGSNQAMLDALGENVGPQLPLWQVALANCLLIFVVYLPLGTLGLWLAQRQGLPGIFRPGDTPWLRFGVPLVLGVVVGLVLALADQVVQRLGIGVGFPHPPFPASIFASLSAGIGEEILFRLFLMSLWVVIFRWLLGWVMGPVQAQAAGLVAANLLAALAFGASHLGTAMVLVGANTPAELPPVMLAEIFLLNGLLGVVAGVLFARRGAIAAMGVHFWADIVWHVVYGVVG